MTKNEAIQKAMRLGKEVERLTHERDTLGQAIGQLAVDLGISRDEAMTGAELLLMTGSIKAEVERLTAEVNKFRTAAGARQDEIERLQGIILYHNGSRR